MSFINKYKNFVTILALCAFLVPFTQSVAKADEWNAFQDEDGIFHVLFPAKYQLNKRIMRLNDQQILSSTDLVATVDQRPYKDIVKDYAVRYDQSFALSIAKNDIPALVEKDVKKYMQYYKSIGGQIISSEQGGYAGRPGAELVVAYTNDEGAVRTARIRIIYSDTTRVEQIAIGPESYEAMFDHRTKDFFSSLQIKNGRTVYPGDISNDWEEVKSPFHLFTINVPKRAPPYVPERAKATSNQKLERISTQLYDPVYDYPIFYNVYGYRMNSLMNMENVQKIIMDRHLKKFRVDIRQIQFVQGASGNYPVISTNMIIPPPEKYPFMNNLMINAYYYGPYLVVQEIAGNNIHLESDIVQRLVKQIEFTPNDAHKKQTAEKEAAKNAPAAETETAPEAEATAQE